MLDDQSIETALARIAETYERLDKDAWRAVLVAESGVSFRLFARRVRGWIRLEISPYLSLPADAARADRLCRELLRRNRLLSEARFSLGDDEEIVLESVVSEDGAPQALASALDGLRVTAEANYSRLLALS